MFRFTLRDLFWATLVVAMGFGWWVHYCALDTSRQAAANHAKKLKTVLATAKSRCGQLEEDVDKYVTPEAMMRVMTIRSRVSYQVDWTVLDEPIP